MSGIFSFIKHPLLGLLEKSNELIPGLVKAIALYYDHNSQSIQCQELSKNASSFKLNQLFINDNSVAENLRKRSFSFQWMSSKNLPFETKEINKKQFNIFDELENVVLCMGFSNIYDSKTDLIFLYLNHNKGNFGISNSSQNLSTGEKSIIGTMAYNTMNIFYKQQLDDAETLKQVNKRINFLQEENVNLNQKLNNLNENYLASIIEMCNTHLVSVSQEYNVQFSFAPDAIEKLQYFNGNIDELKHSLTQSALLALNMNFGQQQDKIVLKAWDINFTRTQNYTEQNNQIQVEERYQKTYLLLNKLEKAARTVVNKNQRLTSENVGHACPSPISAPAISDALKNHQKKLITLMKNNPEKWPTIRTEFRPVKNILANINTS